MTPFDDDEVARRIAADDFLACVYRASDAATVPERDDDLPPTIVLLDLLSDDDLDSVLGSMIQGGLTYEEMADGLVREDASSVSDVDPSAIALALLQLDAEEDGARSMVARIRRSIPVEDADAVRKTLRFESSTDAARALRAQK